MSANRTPMKRKENGNLPTATHSANAGGSLGFRTRLLSPVGAAALGRGPDCVRGAAGVDAPRDCGHNVPLTGWLGTTGTIRPVLEPRGPKPRCGLGDAPPKTPGRLLLASRGFRSPRRPCWWPQPGPARPPRGCLPPCVRPRGSSPLVKTAVVQGKGPPLPNGVCEPCCQGSQDQKKKPTQNQSAELQRAEGGKWVETATRHSADQLFQKGRTIQNTELAPKERNPLSRNAQKPRLPGSCQAWCRGDLDKQGRGQTSGPQYPFQLRGFMTLPMEENQRQSRPTSSYASWVGTQ